MIIILMGVSGSGKTTIGNLLSTRLNWPFYDGDTFHPTDNIAKMRSGIPLNDSDRLPWLQAIRAKIEESLRARKSALFACSALKEEYRQILAGGLSQVFFVHLTASEEILAERVQSRKHEYMPPDLLKSQLATLEAPQASSLVWPVSVGQSVEETLGQILRKIEETS